MSAADGAAQGLGQVGAPDLVRPFILTKGRTRSQRSDIRLETMIELVDEAPPARAVAEERSMLSVVAGGPQSVAEISAHTDLPLGVVTILVGDLLDEGVVALHHTDPVDIEVSALTRMIERVRAL